MDTKYLKTAAMLLSLAVAAHSFAKASDTEDDRPEARNSVAQVQPIEDYRENLGTLAVLPDEILLHILSLTVNLKKVHELCWYMRNLCLDLFSRYHLTVINSSDFDAVFRNQNRPLRNYKNVKLKFPPTDQQLASLSGVAVLDLSRTNFNKVKSLTHLSTLIGLNLSSADCNKFEDLSKLTALQALDVSYTKFNNIKVLSPLTSLTRLSLAACKEISSSSSVNNFEALSKLTALQALDVSYTKFNNIEVLGPLTNLIVLNLSSCGPANTVDGLYLSTFYASCTDFNNTDTLSRLTALKELDVSHTKFNNIEVLVPLTNLTVLNLSGCTYFPNLTTLHPLINLKKLTINSIPEPIVDALFPQRYIKLQDVSTTEFYNIDGRAHVPVLKKLVLENKDIKCFEQK